MTLRNIAIPGAIAMVLSIVTAAQGNAQTSQPWKELPAPPPSMAFPPVADDAAGLPKTVEASPPAKGPLVYPADVVEPLPKDKPTPAAAAPVDDPKVVDAGDLYIASRKYLNKNIMLRKMRCFYADVDDYRCVTDGVFLSVFASAVEPVKAREWLEKYCDQFKSAMRSEKCVFNPSFVYNQDDVREDIVSGYQHRKVIRPAVVTMIPTKQSTPSRSR